MLYVSRMKLLQYLLAAVVGLGAVSAVPSNLDAVLFARAIGDQCSAPEGKGSCQTTSACKGISYPQPLCPKDPDNVQVGHSRGRKGLLHILFWPSTLTCVTVLRDNPLQVFARCRLLSLRLPQRLLGRLLRPSEPLSRQPGHSMLRPRWQLLRLVHVQGPSRYLQECLEGWLRGRYL